MTISTNMRIGRDIASARLPKDSCANVCLRMQIEQMFRTERYRLSHRVRLHLARLLLGDTATDRDAGVAHWGEGGNHVALSVRHLNHGVLMTTAWQVARRCWLGHTYRPTTGDVGFVAVVLEALGRGTSKSHGDTGGRYH